MCKQGQKNKLCISCSSLSPDIQVWFLSKIAYQMVRTSAENVAKRSGKDGMTKLDIQVKLSVEPNLEVRYEVVRDYRWTNQTTINEMQIKN